ncbi:mucin TcMUCII, partial [Trypanosoma cruzi]
MSDVFPTFVSLLMPTRGADLTAARPAECTKRGVEEQAGCRMECKGCCVGWWRSAIFFVCAGNMYALTHFLYALGHMKRNILLRDFFIVLFCFQGALRGVRRTVHAWLLPSPRVVCPLCVCLPHLSSPLLLSMSLTVEISSTPLNDHTHDDDDVPSAVRPAGACPVLLP